MIRFNLIVNRWANFYFFIQNLSEWHFSSRKDYNELWKTEFGEFSNEEETALKKFKEIRLRYKQSKTYFEQAFFTAENPWKYLEKNLPEEEYIAIQEIFNLLEKKFNLIYEKDLSSLNRWKKNLQEKINDSSLVEPITDTLIMLFNAPSSKPEIKIYLLFSTPNHTGGGANVDGETISIEISRYPLNGANHAIGIIWHETIHLCFQNQYFFPLLLKQFPEDQKKVHFINEAIIGSLFPRGILGIKLLKNNPASKLMIGIDSEQTIKIMNLTKEYVNGKKSLDERYIDTIAEILKRESPNVL